MSKKSKNIIKKGELFLFSIGEFSNYGIKATCKAQKDIDVEEIKQQYLEQYPDQEEYCEFEPYRFIKWVLVDQGLAEEISCKELHMDYCAPIFALKDKGLNKEG